MNFLKITCSIILFCILSLAQLLHAAKIDGTTSVVVKTTSYDFDADSSPIGADGAVWLQAGFTAYQDPTPLDTELDIVFPVHGTINLNSGGIVSLLHDVTLGSDAAITSAGYIRGNGNVLYLTNDLMYTGANTLSIIDDCIIDGGGNHFTIDTDSTLSVAASQTLTLKNMDLTLKGSLGAAATGTIVLDNVRFHLASSKTFSTGALTISGCCSIDGPSGTVFTYSSSGALTIQASSQLLLDSGITFKRTGTAAVTFAANTSRLMLRGAIFEATTNALSLLKGQLWVDHYSQVKGTAAITIGDGVTAGNNLDVELLPGATLDISAGTVTYSEA